MARGISPRFRGGTVDDRVRYFPFLSHPTKRDREFLARRQSLSFVDVAVRRLRAAAERLTRRERPRLADPVQHREAMRARDRQLVHQEQKAAKLRGREEEMAAALDLRWERVRGRINLGKPDWEEHGRLLEVGSGAHGMLFGSNSAGAVGVDPLAVDYVKLFPAWQRRIPTVAAEGERLPFGDAVFDAVFCDNVVDHAERPQAIVAEMVRVLAPGGLLYFTVNVHHRLYSLVARAHRRWRAAGIPFEIGPFANHTFHFTVDEARALFSGLPLDIRRERVDIEQAKVQARHRRIRNMGQLVTLAFFKNAPWEVIAERQ